MRRPLRDEISSTSHVPRREPVQRLLRAVEGGGASRRTISLHSKILAGYVVLGLTLNVTFFLTEGQPWVWRAGLGTLITLLLAALQPSLLARVTRVQVLSRSAYEISQGDLSKPVVNHPGSARDEIDELTGAISRMQENLRDLVGKIQDTAKSVADTANDLGRSAENVNGATEEVGSSMDKIAEDAARAAADTSQAAEQGSNAARLAGEKVKKVFNRIEAASHQVFAFGEKTSEISKIVDAITQVAQQTNLLALNATIEAARAGEYGRGFAVVADEVRKLAESAGRSAEQISRLARDISGQSSLVVSAMKEGIAELAEGREDLTTIVRSMGAITDTARNNTGKVHLISDSAREQLEGSKEMVKAIEEISSVARNNAASTEAIQSVIQEQTAAVARMTGLASELTNLSVELQNVVRSFRLGA